MDSKNPNNQDLNNATGGRVTNSSEPIKSGLSDSIFSKKANEEDGSDNSSENNLGIMSDSEKTSSSNAKGGKNAQHIYRKHEDKNVSSGVQLGEGGSGYTGHIKELEGENVALKAEITELQKAVTDLTEEIRRNLAEIDNLHKRHAKKIEEVSIFAASKLLTDLSVPFDHLFSALSVAIPVDLKENDFVKTITIGTEMVKTEFEKVFNKFGLIRIYPLGQKFDHNFHQAISQVPDETKEKGDVIQVVQAGYALHGRVLKPAMVIVVG